MESWKEIAIYMQQQFCELFGQADWDSYKYSELQYLHKKVGYALYGPPEVGNDENYDNNKLSHIKNVCDIIIQEDRHNEFDNSDIWLSIIYLCVVPNGSEGDLFNIYYQPVFRVPKYSHKSCMECTFIDSNCRIYRNWNDFLKNNKLSKCKFCYPVNGTYSLNVNGQVKLEFACSESHCVSQRLCSLMDCANAALTVGCIGISAMALSFPVPAPILTLSVWGNAACRLYGVGRSTNEILDRKQHGESIGLNDPDSICNWFSVIGNILGGTSSLLTRKIAQSSNTVSKAARTGMTVLGVSSFVASNLSVSNNSNEMFKRLKCKISSASEEELTSSVLFFGHSVISSQHSSNDIKFDGTENTKLDIRSKKFNKITDCFCRVSVKECDSKIIRSIQYVGWENRVLPKVQVDDTTRNEIVLRTLKTAPTFSVQHLFKKTNLGSLIMKYFENMLSENYLRFTFSDNIKVIIGFFKKYDLNLALVIVTRIFDAIDFPAGKDLCKILNALYSFIQNVISKLENELGQSSQEEMFTSYVGCDREMFNENNSVTNYRSDDVCSIVLNVLSEIPNYFIMFKEIYEKLFLPMMLESVETYFSRKEKKEVVKSVEMIDTDNLSSIPHGAILTAASELTGTILDHNNTIFSFTENEIFVIVKDTDISINVLRVTWNKINKTIKISILH